MFKKESKSKGLGALDANKEQGLSHNLVNRWMAGRKKGAKSEKNAQK